MSRPGFDPGREDPMSGRCVPLQYSLLWKTHVLVAIGSAYAAHESESDTAEWDQYYST